MKDVMILTGAGQIGMAIARRMGYGMKIVVGDKKLENAQAIAKIMNDAAVLNIKRPYGSVSSQQKKESGFAPTVRGFRNR